MCGRLQIVAVPAHTEYVLVQYAVQQLKRGREKVSYAFRIQPYRSVWVMVLVLLLFGPHTVSGHSICLYQSVSPGGPAIFGPVLRVSLSGPRNSLR